MDVKWHAFGFQREWPKRAGKSHGSIWVEDDGPKDTWTVKCSGVYWECDEPRDAKGCCNFRSAREAMRAADAHVKEFH